jgi:hypothetical protein
MRLVDNPVSFPHVTLFGNGGPCVLVGELPHGGDVYLGVAEMSVAAPLLGFLSPEQAAQKDKRIAELERELLGARAMVERIRNDVLAAA